MKAAHPRRSHTQEGARRISPALCREGTFYALSSPGKTQISYALPVVYSNAVCRFGTPVVNWAAGYCTEGQAECPVRDCYSIRVWVRKLGESESALSKLKQQKTVGKKVLEVGLILPCSASCMARPGEGKGLKHRTNTT